MRISFLTRTTITLFLIAISSAFLLKSFSDHLKEKYQTIAVMQCQSFATEAITKTIQKNLKEQDEFQSSILLYKDENFRELNVAYINSLLKDVSKNIYETLTDMEKGKGIIDSDSFYQTGIVTEIPFSLIFDNPFLATLGPTIPICFRLMGDVKTDLISKVSSFGLNNGLIELLIQVEIKSMVYVPLLSTSEIIQVELPIYSSILEGEIPSIALGNHSIDGVQQSIYGESVTQL